MIRVPLSLLPIILLIESMNTTAAQSREMNGPHVCLDILCLQVGAPVLFLPKYMSFNHMKTERFPADANICAPVLHRIVGTRVRAV